MTENNISMRLLDLSNPQEIEKCERLFYSSFINMEKHKTFRKIWIFDDTKKRAKSIVPYSDQVIYTFGYDKEILLAVAVNINVSKFSFQSKEYGFRIPFRNNQKKYCEILSLFSISALATKSRMCEVFESLLYNYQITDALATTSKKTLRFYLRLGFSAIDFKELKTVQDERYLLQYDVQSLFRERRLQAGISRSQTRTSHHQNQFVH
jgi:hypothetical protein